MADVVRLQSYFIPKGKYYSRNTSCFILLLFRFFSVLYQMFEVKQRLIIVGGGTLCQYGHVPLSLTRVMCAGQVVIISFKFPFFPSSCPPSCLPLASPNVANIEVVRCKSFVPSWLHSTHFTICVCLSFQILREGRIMIADD